MHLKKHKKTSLESLSLEMPKFQSNDNARQNFNKLMTIFCGQDYDFLKVLRIEQENFKQRENQLKLKISKIKRERREKIIALQQDMYEKTEKLQTSQSRCQDKKMQLDAKTKEVQEKLDELKQQSNLNLRIKISNLESKISELENEVVSKKNSRHKQTWQTIIKSKLKFFKMKKQF